MIAVPAEQLLQVWAEAIDQAFMLAKGERLREIRGERKTRAFDQRGLHPYSECWGIAVACERLWPVLGEVRDLGLPCDAYTLKLQAYRAAEASFAEQAREGGVDLWAHA